LLHNDLLARDPNLDLLLRLTLDLARAADVAFAGIGTALGGGIAIAEHAMFQRALTAGGYTETGKSEGQDSHRELPRSLVGPHPERRKREPCAIPSAVKTPNPEIF
jgi:hypothetical protein